MADLEGSPTLGVLLAIADFPVLAAGYRAVIDAAPDLRLVGLVESRERLVEEVALTAADIVVAECPASAGADDATWRAFGEIRAANPATRILAVELRCGGERVPVAIRAGAHGFVTREAAPADVLAALRSIGRGETCASVPVTTPMVARRPGVVGGRDS